MTRTRGLIGIGDRQYELAIDKYARRPIAAVREQVDQNRRPGEGSLGNTAIWDRTGRDFVHGAGQEYFDEDDSDDRRFHTSTGIDPWNRRSLKLLHAAQVKRASLEENQEVFATSVLWHVAGETLARSADGDTFTVITGLSANDILSTTTNGTAVWLTDGLDIYKVDDHTDTAGSVFSTSNMLRLGYANGHLLGGGSFSDTHKLYEIDGGGSATELYVHPAGAGFGEWGNFTEAPNGIYVTFSTTERSTVYYIGADPADGSLTAPLAMGSTHRIRSMEYAAGLLVIGTEIGFQLAEVSSGANTIRLGPSVAIDEPVLCSTFDGFHIWYGRTRTEGVSGLGRLDPSSFTSEALVPAYADDLAGSAVGTVNGVASFLGKRWFTISGVGLHGETDSYVATGTYRSGGIAYGIPYSKSIAGAEVRHKPLPTAASVELRLVDEDEVTLSVLSSTNGKGKAASVTDFEAEVVDVEVVLHRGADATLTPEVTRWTLRAIPQPFRSEEIYLTVKVADMVTVNRVDSTFNTLDDWAYLKGLERTRQRVDCNIGAEDFIAYVDAVAVDPGDAVAWNRRDEGLDGVVTVKLVTVDVGGN